jgi:hypothetical protein
MALSKKPEENLSTEERGVKALERIAVALEDINDWCYSLETKAWSERLEWYLNEFHNIAKTKTIGTSNRPTTGSEREEA